MDWFDGEQLYRLVEEYSSIGDHRTGSGADRATVRWLSAELERIGAEVSTEPFPFERYEASTRLLLTEGSGLVEVPSAAVFYSAAGARRTGRLQLVRVPAGQTGEADTLDPLLDQAAADGLGGLVVAIDGPDDLPVQANRWPVMRGPVPAVIVPDNWTDRVAAAIAGDRAELQFEASTSPAEGWNVLARLGPAHAPPVIVTTPVTGWYRCAAERGTGIAAALALAESLSTDHLVEFVGCGGHELHFRGLEHHLELRRQHQSSAAGLVVVQLGASVGATVPTADGPGVLDPARRVLTTAAGELRDTVAQMAAPGNWTMADPGNTTWPGESGVWQRAGAEVLAFLGHSHWFHTASDLPELATSAEAMATATSVAVDTARYYVARTTSDQSEGGRRS